jgi:anti-sigma regulatory factor (Ser/Thr protein kinase)
LSVPCATRSLTVVAKPASLGAVTEFVRKGALEANLPEERIAQLDLLVDELIMNVCTHAYPDGRPGDVTVTYSVPGPGELSVEVADQGVEFNPLKVKPPDLALSLEARPVGGLGIHLVKTFAKSLTYRREQGWNRLTFAL